MSSDEVREFVRTFGKRAEKTLSTLGKDLNFITAINTPVGEELLKDLVSEYHRLLDRVASLDCSDDEKARYKVVRDLIARWSQKIAEYENRVDFVKDKIQETRR